MASRQEYRPMKPLTSEAIEDIFDELSSEAMEEIQVLLDTLQFNFKKRSEKARGVGEQAAKEILIRLVMFGAFRKDLPPKPKGW